MYVSPKLWKSATIFSLMFYLFTILSMVLNKEFVDALGMLRKKKSQFESRIDLKIDSSFTTALLQN